MAAAIASDGLGESGASRGRTWRTYPRPNRCGARRSFPSAAHREDRQRHPAGRPPASPARYRRVSGRDVTQASPASTACPHRHRACIMAITGRCRQPSLPDPSRGRPAIPAAPAIAPASITGASRHRGPAIAPDRPCAGPPIPGIQVEPVAAPAAAPTASLFAAASIALATICPPGQHVACGGLGDLLHHLVLGEALHFPKSPPPFFTGHYPPPHRRSRAARSAGPGPPESSPALRAWGD